MPNYWNAHIELREIFSRHFESIRTPIQSVLGVSIGVVEVDAAHSRNDAAIAQGRDGSERR